MSEPILYIDDEPINLESFKYQFESYQVFTALSAYEAYKILAENEIKVVISDQRMPEVTGIELLEVVKNQYPNIVRILLTAFLQEEYLLEAINRGGVYRYVTKPWNYIELDSIIKNAIEIFNLKAENQNLIAQLKEKVTQLSISEEKFRNIFNSSSEGILILNSKSKIINANKAISNMVKIPVNELPGMYFCNFIDPQQRELLINCLQNQHDCVKIENIEFKITDNTYSTIYAEIKSNAIEYEGEVATIIVLHDVTEKKQFERKLYSAQINAEEKERERIAKELHDGIGPLLSTLKIYLYDIQKTVPPEYCSESVSKAGEIINDSITTVKEISNNVSPHILRNFGLSQAIQEFVNKLKISPTLRIHFNSELTERLPEIIEITFYRITTELLNNTVKYAQAKNIQISISLSQKQLNYSYRDDGVGFDYNSKSNNNTGFGLRNIQSRVRQIGGNISFLSSEGKGISVSINANI
jgi:PAS domain S-box-containing protein